MSRPRTWLIMMAGLMVVLSCNPQQQTAPPTRNQPLRKPQSLATAPARPLNTLWPSPHQWDVAGFDDLKLTVAPRPAAPHQRTHRVQPGESLMAIAKQYYNDTKQWRRIFDANKDILVGPNSVKAGMILLIPE